MFEMVANLVKVHSEGKVNDVDMYNAILRLVANSDSWDGDYLKKVVEFQDKYEDKSTDRPENYILLAKDLGEPYTNGLLRLI